MAGKAKRFNSYDSAVSESRKIVEGFGRQRQNLSIGSSFRSQPLEPPIATPGVTATTSTPSDTSFPLDYSIDDQGTKSSGTVTHDLSLATAHMLKFQIEGDVTVAFSNIPVSGTGIDWYVEVTQANSGGHTITWPAAVTPTLSLIETDGTVSLVAFHTNDNGTIIRAITLLNSGIASSTVNLSDVIIDTNFDANGVHKFVLDSDDDTYIIGDTDDQIEFFTAGTEKLRLTTKLQLQGGTDLDVNGNDILFEATGVTKLSGTSTLLTSTVNNVTTFTVTTTNLKMDTGTDIDLNDNKLKFDSAGSEYFVHDTGEIEAYTGGVERLFIDSSGLTIKSGHLIDSEQYQFTALSPPGQTSAKIFQSSSSSHLIFNTVANQSLEFRHGGTTALTINPTFTEIRHTTQNAELDFFREDLTPTDDDVIGRINFIGINSVSAGKTYAKIECITTDVSSTTEDGDIVFYVMNAGTLTKICTFDGSTGRTSFNSDVGFGGNDLISVGSVNIDSPTSITGARDDPEGALANLLSDLDSIGLIDDDTTAS